MGTKKARKFARDASMMIHERTSFGKARSLARSLPLSLSLSNWAVLQRTTLNFNCSPFPMENIRGRINLSLEPRAHALNYCSTRVDISPELPAPMKTIARGAKGSDDEPF